MARYINKISVPFDPNLLTNGITEYLTAKGFSLADYFGSPMWRKGTGMTVGKYVEILYEPGAVVISAFITMTNVAIGFEGAAESALTGFYGCIPKRALKKVVTGLEELIRNRGQ